MDFGPVLIYLSRDAPSLLELCGRFRFPGEIKHPLVGIQVLGTCERVSKKLFINLKLLHSGTTS